MDSKTLRQMAESLFAKRLPLINLWQEIAENFYPERADFTYKRHLGTDFAGNLSTSYPILCRREFSDQMASMLRNTEKQWFHIIANHVSEEDHETNAWMEWATRTQRLAMYDTHSLFVKAAKEADADWAAFGQSVESVRLSRDQDNLLYRCWHLRDCAWMEDSEGKICAVFRKFNPTAYALCQLFDKEGRGGVSVHRGVKKMLDKTPFDEVNCLHMIVKSEMFDGPDNGKPWRSIYYDMQHSHEMESIAQWNREYNISRWQTVSGSQYAFSPATVAALPEARLLQAMTYTLLEAGEKAVNPPMVATSGVVRSDIGIFPGGITWVDRDYDERFGPALRALVTDPKGVPFAVESQAQSRALLSQCFYLNKLTLPQRGPEMTAYEVGQRIQEYIRGALPLFEPMEVERNGGICELTFDVLMQNGGFGAREDIPQRLQGRDIEWRFASPLHDTIDQQKGQKLIEMKEIIAVGAALDKNVLGIPNAVVAIRDALRGVGVPTKWTRSETEVKEMMAEVQAKQQAEASLATMAQGADVAKTAAEAGRTMAETQAIAA